MNLSLMVRVVRPRLLLLLSVLLLGVWFVALFLAGGSAAVRSQAQLALLPLLLLLLSRVRLFGAQIPNALLLAACVIGLTGAVVHQQGTAFEPGTFLVTRFEGDRLGGETKIARDKIRASLGSEVRVPITDTARTVQSNKEARKILDTRANLAGVVWGSGRWATVTLRESAPISLQALAERSVGARYLKTHQLRDLLIVTSLPSVGVSFVNHPQGIEFLSRLIAVWGSFAEAIVHTGDTSYLQQQLLLQAASLVAWTSPEPQVFSQWMLGSYYLGQAMIGTDSEPAMFACARETLRHGYRKLRRKEAPLLEAAIINNYVIAQLFGRDGVMSFEEASIDAIKQLRTAYLLVANPRLNSSSKELPVLAAVIRDNIRYLKSSYAKQKRTAKSR